MDAAATAFYNLDFEQALAEHRRTSKERPNDLAAWNGTAYTLMYREMFRNGSLETQLVTGNNAFLRRAKMNPEPAVMQEFEGAIGRVMALTEARIAKNPNDTGALYARGAAHGMRANWNYLVRKAWMDSLKDATEARKLHMRVTEIDPNFTDAKLVQGMHEYVIGSLSWHYKALGFLAGFRGDRERGIQMLEEVARNGRRSRFDAQMLLAALYRREKRPQDALPLLTGMSQRFPRNFLLRLEMAQMYADLGNKDDAIAQYETIRKNKEANLPGYEGISHEKILYYEGNLLFWYNEFDQAIERLKRVTPKAREMDLNTGVYSWLRLGQSYDMKGNRTAARSAYQQVMQLAPDSEAAKEAKRFSDSPYQRKG